jgi:hypothetical protein
MPLLVPDDSAYMNYILPDLLRIVDEDTSVGDEKAAGPGLKVITYGHTKQGFAQSQFYNIVWRTQNYNILLKYVKSDFPLPEDPPVNIALRQGATYAPGSGTANPDDSGVILVYLADIPRMTALLTLR